jgi:hypothetical protein
MSELIELARIAARGTAAAMDLQNRLGGSLRRQMAFRRAVLRRATAEERRIADFARDYNGSGFRVLCDIAARHGRARR